MRRAAPSAYVLAAGLGRRMGSPKALLPYRGEALLCAIARRYHEEFGTWTVGLVEETVAEILRAQWTRRSADRDPRDVFGEIRLRLIRDVDPEQAMMDSVRIAFRDAIESGTEIFFLQPVDAGVPSSEVLRALVDRIEDRLVAKPCHDDRGGHPLLITSRGLDHMDWERADSLREALRALPEDSIRRVECQDAGILRNWNRPEDLDAELEREIDPEPGGESDGRLGGGLDPRP